MKYSFKKTIGRYGFIGICSLIINLLYTKILFKKVRLIRRPIYIRGKKNIRFGNEMTTGVGCRLEAISQTNNSDKIIIIGSRVQINDYVHIAGIEKVIISDDVLIASRVFISDHNHGTYSGNNQSSPYHRPEDRKLSSQKVVIENKVWIGEGVCILQGVTIGEGSIIGANSVVNRDIPPYSIAAGIPAKVIKTYNFNSKKWERV